MVRVPFIGRLTPWEYVALVGSFILIALEAVVRVITLALPGPIIRLCYQASRRIFNSLSSPAGRRSRSKKRAIVSSIAHASDFVELCELYGYYAEEHIVQTGDGYLLGLHRLGWKQGEEDQRVNSGEGSIQKRVVYLHHGLMMNSDVWVCLTEKERCLPFLLVEKGYDVWLGNNRGNKYSKKSLHHGPTSTGFWDFSIDQFAFHDIPDSISYILDTTHQPSLSYIGFSQGTAQAFAALAIHPPLNAKVDVFVALAPAMSPGGLASNIVDSMVKASPEVMFLAFGRKALLTSATMWQAILYPPIFVRFIDLSLTFLFGWKTRNITPHQKLAAYPHLYSFTSVKSLVHWFQIIRTGQFQMYDDEMQSPLSISDHGRFYKVAKFPTRNIKTPIVLVYGGSDSLVDIDVMRRELPRHTVAKEVPHYEHLDFLWAEDVAKQVFPVVFDALDAAHGESRKPRAIMFKTDDRYLPAPEDSPPQDQYTDDDYEATPTKKISENIRPGTDSLSRDIAASPNPSSKGRSPVSRIRIVSSSSPAGSQAHTGITERSGGSRPEGWWSSDDVAETEPSTPADMILNDPLSRPSERKPGHRRSPSRASQMNYEGSGNEAKFERGGISLGAGKAVSGLVATNGVGSASASGSAGEGKRKKKRRKE